MKADVDRLQISSQKQTSWYPGCGRGQKRGIGDDGSAFGLSTVHVLQSVSIIITHPGQQVQVQLEGKKSISKPPWDPLLGR